MLSWAVRRFRFDGNGNGNSDMIRRFCISVLLWELLGFAIAFRDPAIDAKLEHLVSNFGYPFETHEVVTSDGYILGMHRIPGKRLENGTNAGSLPPVLMMHGLLGGSADWLVTGPNKSLAFLMHDLGYDVWLGNNRGNMYSKSHTTLSPKNFKFWDFSWHELGVYDTPALIDYILAKTNHRKLYYVGFSQGCTQFYIMGSLKPEYNNKVILMSALAPAAYTGNLRGLLKPISAFVNIGRFASELTVYFEFLPESILLQKFTGIACRKGMYTQPLCKILIFITAGFSMKEEMNEEDLPLFLQFAPAGCSTKQLLHYGMGVKNPGHFRQYDYGGLKNLRTYKSLTPPEYPLYKVTAPVAIYHGKNDWLAHPDDVALLAGKLPNVVDKFEVTVKYLNHFDFIYANDIDTLVYNRLIHRINTISSVTN